MFHDSDVEGAGRNGSLIRIVTDAIVARARRVYVAVAAQLLRGVWSMRTENVVDTLFLSLVGC